MFCNATKIESLMKLFTILMFLFVSATTIAQKLELELPTQDADSLSIGSFKISIDTITKELEIVHSDYSIDRVHHTHRRYRTSLYELDTVGLFYATDSTQYEIRFFMCDGREFELDDPYKGEIKYSFLNKKMVRLGFWNLGPVENQLNEIVETLSRLIPKKEACSKRDFRSFVGHHYLIGRSGDGVYSSGVQMPSLDGSNSIATMNAAVQKRMDECLPTMVGEQVIKLSFKVDENGNVFDPFCFDCPKDLQDQMYDCIGQTKWEPAIYDGKDVKAECSALLGFNVEDKYAYFEQKSKEPDVVIKREPVYIPDDAFGMGSSNDEEIFKIVEQMPKPASDDFYEIITERAKKTFPDKVLNEVFQFVVEKDGSISQVECLRSTDQLVRGFIMANIRNAERFTPGKQRGKTVRVALTFKVRS